MLNGLSALPRVQTRPPTRSKTTTKLQSQQKPSSSSKYSWTFSTNKSKKKNNIRIEEISLSEIRRPLQYVRVNDNDKVEALMASIQEIGKLFKNVIYKIKNRTARTD